LAMNAAAVTTVAMAASTVSSPPCNSLILSPFFSLF
jgi:hypothetical protein